MIEKLDIAKFGSFEKFQWDTEVREANGAAGRFKKLNIIYGRNYSGKTTLSRALRSFEVGHTPTRYENPAFTIKTSNGSWTQEQLAVQGSPIRVYNKDFVESNLAFLRDEDGQITPFAILGSENKEVEHQIAQVMTELGSKESGTGLRGAYAKKRDEVINAKKLLRQKNEALNKKLFDKANNKPHGIKHNPLYSSPYYDVRHLDVDITKVASMSLTPLDDLIRAEKVKLLTEKALQDISGQLVFQPDIQLLGQKARSIAAEKVRSSEPLQDLLNSAVLAHWVKEGRGLHADRDTCAFCRNPLSAGLWEILDKHFNEESEALQKRIDGVAGEIDAERWKLNSLALPARAQFYSVFHEKHDELKKIFDTVVGEYETALEGVARVIRERSENIFIDKQLDEIPVGCAAELEAVIADVNRLIQSSNAHTKQLGTNHTTLRDELRLSEVASFIIDSGLNSAGAEIIKDEFHGQELATGLAELEAKGKVLNVKLEALKTQLRDEKRGAEQVNRYLGHSLGGTDLRLVAEEQEGLATYRFRIMRGKQPAYNLSEGECSLVSFCYFLARLGDAQTQGTSPIIYIDDPISSLDNNHIFFIFSLIESFIAKPLRGTDGNELKDAKNRKVFKYEQLFISTHNLDFLKYLRRLSKPDTVEHFMIVRKASSSSIGLMPKYLRMYITELNYLFGEIHTCVDETKSTSSYHSFYNFGNNLRKFLEAFLFFRYPSGSVNNDSRLRLFFDDEANSADFVQRLTNEHSHLEEFIDRGMVPIDCAEISRTASFVLKTMRDKDPVQYAHFIESVGATDPFAVPPSPHS